MNNQSTFTVLCSLTSLLGIIYLVFWRYRRLGLDWFRQDIFDLREQLDDYAASGKIRQDDEVYEMLRRTMNGYIKYASQTTNWHGVIFPSLASRRDQKSCKDGLDFEQAWTRSLRCLSPDVKQDFERLRQSIDRVVFRFLLLSSPEISIMLTPVGLLLGVVYLVHRRYATRLLTAFKKRLSETDGVAYIYGETI